MCIIKRSLHLLWDRGSVQQSKKHLHGPSTVIWLIFADGFKNTPASTCTQFGFIGLHAGAVMMALCNADSGSVRKTSKLVESKLENAFLLPLLKQSRFSKPGQKLIKTAKKRVLAGYRTQHDKVLSIVPKDPSPMDGHLM